MIDFPPNTEHPDPPEVGMRWPTEGPDQWEFTEGGFWKRVAVPDSIVQTVEDAVEQAQEAAADAIAAAEAAEAAVLGTELEGLSTATATAVTSSDTVLEAFGKLQAQVTDHAEDDANPHGVTKSQVGLGNVDNTSDEDKPVSTAQAAAIAQSKSILEINEQTDDYTLELTDAGKCVSVAAATAKTVTVPAEADVDFPLNTIVFVLQAGVGDVDVAGDDGVTVNAAEGLNVGGQYKMVSLIKTGADTWLLVGGVA